MASSVDNISRNIIDVFLKLIQSLECPVCYEYVDAPVWQCEAGHIICNKCKYTLYQCPTCRRPFSGVRARNVEQISDVMLFPCKNDGCVHMFPLTELRRHEDQCTQATASSRPDHVMRSATLQYNILKYIERDISPFFVTKKDTKEQVTQTDEEQSIMAVKDISGMAESIRCMALSQGSSLNNPGTSNLITKENPFTISLEREFGSAGDLLKSSLEPEENLKTSEPTLIPPKNYSSSKPSVVENVLKSEPSTSGPSGSGSVRIEDMLISNGNVFQFTAAHGSIQAASSTSRNINDKYYTINDKVLKARNLPKTKRSGYNFSTCNVIKPLSNLQESRSVDTPENNESTQIPIAAEVNQSSSISDLNKISNYIQFGDLSFDNNGKGTLESAAQKVSSIFKIEKVPSTSLHDNPTALPSKSVITSTHTGSSHSSSPSTCVTSISEISHTNSSDACVSKCSVDSMNVSSINGVIQSSGICNQTSCINSPLDTSCKSTSFHKGCVTSPFVTNSSQKSILSSKESEESISHSLVNLGITFKPYFTNNDGNLCRRSFKYLPNNNNLNDNFSPLSGSSVINTTKSVIDKKPNMTYSSNKDKNSGSSISTLIHSKPSSYNLRDPLNCAGFSKSDTNKTNNGLMIDNCFQRSIFKSNVSPLKIDSPQELSNNSQELCRKINIIGSENPDPFRNIVQRTQVQGSVSRKQIRGTMHRTQVRGPMQRTQTRDRFILDLKRTKQLELGITTLQEHSKDSQLLGSTLNVSDSKDPDPLRGPIPKTTPLSIEVKNMSSITNKSRDITISEPSGINSIPSSCINFSTSSNSAFEVNIKPLFTIGCGNKGTSLSKRRKNIV